MDDNAGRYVEQLTSSATSTSNGDVLIVSYSQVTGSSLVSTLAYLFIGLGCVIVFATFIGCCGAIRESQCLLFTFFASLFVIFVILVGIGIWAFAGRKDVDAHTVELQQITNKMIQEGVSNYYRNNESSRFMDTVQKKFRCCGADNAAGDYEKDRTKSVPATCEVKYRRRSCLPSYFRYVGDQFEKFMEDRLVVAAGVAIALAIYMMIGMTVSMLLCYALKDRTWNTNA
ncbi:tetraspanin-2-like isoform X2 [Pomacea canaliculata]|nr:tetraspanin-2-like isoform X2 [Pomacea canaliculata]